MTKMPAPTRAPVPRKMRSQGPRTRLSPCVVAVASRVRSSSLLVWNSLLFIPTSLWRLNLLFQFFRSGKVGRQRRIVFAALLAGRPLLPPFLNRLRLSEEIKAGGGHDFGSPGPG